MLRGSLQVLGAFLAATPLAAADEPVCANCWDGPEMFEHRRDKWSEPVIEAISVGEFPDKEICSFGEVRMVFGGRKWLVTHCGDDKLMISAAPKNPVSEVFTLEKDDGRYRLVGEPPEDDRAAAAYLELRALTTEQTEKLVREVREVRKSQ